MNSEQEKELIAYLKSLGFEGEKLEVDLGKQISLGHAYFNVSHEIRYGEERMHFELRLKKDLQFSAYRLEEYKATHRKPVEIEHGTIDGIDIRQLEERMNGQPWDVFLEDPAKITDPALRSHMHETLDILKKLSEGRDLDGRKIQEQLTFNYWPRHAYDHSHRQDLKYGYERSREFSASEYGICNANLAYHILSGRLNELYERLEVSGLGSFTGLDLHQKLEDILSENPGRFEITCSRNEPEGLIEYRIPVHRTQEGFHADTNHVTFTPHPPIEHGGYNEVDSAELEQRMQNINWSNDRELFIFHEDREPELYPEASDIQNQMHRLSQDTAGADVAEQLQLKYWIGVTFFDGLIPSTAWHELENRLKIQQHLPLDFDARSIFNLMCGRWVIDKAAHEIEPEQGAWLRLRFNEQDESGMHPLQRVTGFPVKSLEDILDRLPIHAHEFYSARDALMSGALFKVPLKSDKEILLEASPEQRTLNLYTPDMKPIPFNFHFDPDWRPPLEQTPELAQKREAKQHKKASLKLPARSKRKGRGI